VSGCFLLFKQVKSPPSITGNFLVFQSHKSWYFAIIVVMSNKKMG
jgi:hypothetical protein